MDMQIRFGKGRKVSALFKGFEIQTDQPASAGGESSAPSPVDLFLASIGTCIGYYVLAFCQGRNLDHSNISIDVEFYRPGKMVETVKTKISLPADFPEKYHMALISTAESCLVKKHLEQPPKFEITIAEA